MSIPLIIPDSRDSLHAEDAAEVALPSLPVSSTYLKAQRMIISETAADNVADLALTNFPSLTGLRPIAGDDKTAIATRELNCTIHALRNAAQSVGTTAEAVLQLVWSHLLSLYTGLFEVTFLTILVPSDVEAESASEERFERSSFRRPQLDSGSTTQSLPYHDGRLSNQPFLREQILSLDLDGQWQEGTLLDLTNLTSSNGASFHSATKATNFRDDFKIRVAVSCDRVLNLHAHLYYTGRYLNEHVADQILEEIQNVLTNILVESSSLDSPSSKNSRGCFANSFRNQGKVTESGFKSLHAQFEQVAREYPGRIALDFRLNLHCPAIDGENTLWTYQELNSQAEALAGRLYWEHGVRRNMVVPICLKRSPQLYVAVLGILKAGAAWCPIDPSSPPQRRLQLIHRTGGRTVIVDSQSPLDGYPEEVQLVSLSDTQTGASSKERPRDVSPDDIAYLIWTSGTTGEPKGVPIHHEAAIASMKALQAAVTSKTRAGKPLRCLQFAQFTFDVFVQDLFYTWGLGGTLISSTQSLMLGSFSTLATKTEATHAHLTPAFAASLPRSSCHTLEVVTMIGEKLTQSVADEWSENLDLFNTYGPAEATVVSTLRHVPRQDPKRSANIGLPLPSVEAFVIRDGQPVPMNCVGELALAGPQLSKGYWFDVEKTKARFIYIKAVGKKIYLTGDMVRLLHDGSLEFIGRTDDLLKIQGIRVELSEINYAIRESHPLVQQIETLFLSRPDRPSKVLVTFLAAPSLASGCPEPLFTQKSVEIAKKTREEAQKYLPDYMVPKIFLIIGQIPQTSSAKTDKSSLSDLYTQANLGAWESMLVDSTTEPIAEELAYIEREIMEYVASLTGSSKVSVTRESPLSSLGIDSIKATELVRFLDSKNINIALMDVLRCQTFGQLLKSISDERPRTVENSNYAKGLQAQLLVSLSPESAPKVAFIAPCLAIQESLLAEAFREPASYWRDALFVMGRNTDLKQLRESWNELVKRTDALRLSFFAVADLVTKPETRTNFVQVISKDMRMDFAIIESSQALFSQHAQARAKQVAQRCHDSRFQTVPWAITIFLLESHCTMMVTIHHSICDESSLNFLMSDLWEIENQNKRDAGCSPRPQLETAIQVLLPSPETVHAHEGFWGAATADFNYADEQQSWPILNSSHNAFHISTVSRTWQPEVSCQELEKCAAGLESASIVSVLRLVWSCIVLEYMETDRVVIGETWSMRGESAQLSDVIGPLVCVIPVPVIIKGSLKAMSQSLESVVLQARQHLAFHPQMIRKLLRVSDDQALYPAIFNFITEPSSAEQEFHWTEIPDVVDLTVEHPIAFNAVLLSDGSLNFEVVASRQHMDQENLDLFAKQIDALINLVLQSSDSSMRHVFSHLPLHLKSVTASQDDALGKQQNQPLTAWVDHYDSESPDSCAVEAVYSLEHHVTASKTWSYRELRHAYLRVGALINSLEFEQRFVAVLLDHGLDVHAVVLGIMASNNIYLPIAQDLPGERMRFLLKDSNAAMLFTSRSLFNSLTDIPPCHVAFVEDLDYWNGSPFAQLNISPQPTDGAYLLYTSGSTGQPKGVLVSRGNLYSFIEAISKFICCHVDMASLKGIGKYLGIASYAFDVHLLEMFFAWRHCMATVAAPRAMLLENLEIALQRLKITHASFVPSLVDNAGLEPKRLPNLRYISVGGEKITKKAIDTWSHSHVVIANAYGPTEATIGCCFKKVDPGTSLRNIGTPLAFTTVHVLKFGAADYAIRGTAGELCLTGDLVATGYFNRPEAKGFVDDLTGQRMYRTGDRVRLMADGSLEFLGRQDDQTKIRGQRIELGEVSEAVRSAASRMFNTEKVEVTSLVVQHPRLARPQLVSFLALPKANAADPRSATEDPPVPIEFKIVESIRDQIRQSLPSFMVPDTMILVGELPLVNVSKKVDVKALKRCYTEMPPDGFKPGWPPGTATYSHRRLTPKEEKVVNCVSQAFGIDREKVGGDSNLFALGMDSLNVISLMVMLQKIGLGCTVSKILQSPTVEKLAQLPYWDTRYKPTDEYHSDKARLKEPQIDTKSSLCAIRRCLPLQETLVATSLDSVQSPLYVNHILFRISSHVNIDRFVEAWKKTAKEHEILRTVFLEIGTGFYQGVLEQSTLECYRYNRENPEEWLSSQRNRIAAEIVSSMTTSPPFRLNVAASGNECLLQVSLHHALYDLRSLNIILETVQAKYVESIEKRPLSSVKALVDYVLTQDPQAANQYWKAYLNNYEVTLFDPNPGATSATVCRKLAQSFSQVASKAASIHCTVASLLQALFGIALAQSLQRSDVVFGTILSGRAVPVEDIDTIVAPCITNIPQRVKIENNDLPSVVKVSIRGFLESMDYQHTALKDIHRWIESDCPLFDILFTYVNADEQLRCHSDLWEILSSSMSNEFPLAVEVEGDATNDGISARCEFQPMFGSKDRGCDLLEKIDCLLTCLCTGEKVSLLDSIPEQIRQTCELPDVQGDEVWKGKRQQISEALTALLGRRIPDNTSFFSVGIDSILAIQFSKRLREIGTSCSMTEIMRHASIEKLAKHLSRSYNGQYSSKTERPFSSVEKSILPEMPVLLSGTGDLITKKYQCTPIQSSMLTQSLGSDGSLYVNQHCILLKPGVERAKVISAWDEMVNVTEILRTSFHFHEAAGVWIAAVHSGTDFEYTTLDNFSNFLNALSSIRKSFQFQKESDFHQPLWRMHALKNKIILTMHHALYDGEALHMIFKTWARIVQGQRAAISPPFSQAADVANSLQEEANEFWLRRLASFSPPCVRGSRLPRRSLTTTLNLDLSEILLKCQSLEVTLQAAVLLALGKSIAQLRKVKDIVFGHVVRGRSIAHSSFDETIGPMFNTTPFRIDFHHLEGTNKHTLSAIQDSVLESQNYHYASMGKVQQAWRERSGYHDVDLFDTIFVFQNHSEDDSGQPWTFHDLPETGNPTEYATNFEITQRQNSVQVSINSDRVPDLHTFIKRFEKNLHELLIEPSNSALSGFVLSSCQSKVEEIHPTKNHILEEDILMQLRNNLAIISNIPATDIDDETNISSLGLDSISALKIVTLSRKQGLQVTIADVMQGRNLRGILHRLADKESVDTELTAIGSLSEDKVDTVLKNVGCRSEDVDEIFPCLAGQLYHLKRWLGSGRTMGEASWIFRANILEEQCLLEAWRCLRERHGVLRTIFSLISKNEVAQVVLKPSRVRGDAFSVLEVNDEREIPTVISLESRRKFDLYEPPCALVLLRLPGFDLVLLKLHHALYDALTISLLFNELDLLYRRQHLPRRGVQGKAIWQQISRYSADQSRQFWSKALHDCHRTILASEHGQSPGVVHVRRDASYLLQNRPGTVQWLSMIVLVAFGRALADFTSSSNPVFGFFHIGRSNLDMNPQESSLPLLNMTPLSISGATSRGATDLMRNLREDLEKRIPYEQDHVDHILYSSGHDQGPLFNAFINILPDDSEDSQSDEKTKRVMERCEAYDKEVSDYRRTISGRTSIDGLSVANFADNNVFLDVRMNLRRQALELFVRSDRRALAEDKCEMLLQEVTLQIKRILEELNHLSD